MIEPIMFVGIGFLVASLLVIGLIPLVHHRAVRLTQKRLEALTPLSMAEIQADKDQLRAEFAMSTRRLEMSVEQMKAKTSSQLAEIGKKSDAISRLKLELGEKTAAMFALEARERQLTEDLGATQQELQGKTVTADEAERKFAETSAELASLTSNLHETSMTADSQRVELASLRAQAEVFKGQIATFEKDTQDLRTRLDDVTAAAETANEQLTDERAKTDILGTRIEELERALVAQTTEAEILGRRVEELMGRLDEQGRFLAEREYASDQLRNQASMAQKTEADVRAELTEAENRRRIATETLRAEKALVEEQLRKSQDERALLQREIASMKRQAESTWESERMENAALRERINDVAAEVARLTSTLEGPNSPIDQILASEASRSPGTGHGTNGNNGHGDKLFGASADPSAPKGTLADRIRALQGRTSRLPQAS